MYKLCFYVPVSHLELVKQAVFSAGAGRVGEYENCCWQALGQGQFKPLAGSQPFIGKLGQSEVVDEYKVEMVCADDKLKPAIVALKQAHPYEQPAYNYWLVYD